MNTQRLLIALSVVNVALLTLALVRPGAARTDEPVAPVLRGRALEIVDDRGRVRAIFRCCLLIPPSRCRTAPPDTRRRYCFG